ncbi:hypothetical protein B0I35DRAFT_421487 [Stachybotrys elegans]|uniref:Vacuolar protein sorting-associated protein 62 n=1 Tax=Stachybotrys elegans TaxID=80388 RepID=A0A8K0WUQ8_9HYPO|nr:hypothetical protein B0I35DRAFT_421487 [Stachybotrys elegans]
MYWLRRATILLALLLTFCFVAWLAPRALDPVKHDAAKRWRDRLWVESSPYFWDRQSCRWLSLCGLHHLRKDPAEINSKPLSEKELRWKEWQEQRQLRRRSWDDIEHPPLSEKKKSLHDRRKVLKDVPDFVLKYAPLVHLYSGEHFWPSDIKDHLGHMTAYVDEDPINGTEWTLANLDELNDKLGRKFLHSQDDVESRPDWLHSENNKPADFDPRGAPHQDPATGRGQLDQGEPTTWWDADKAHPVHRISDPREHKFASGSPFDRPRRIHPRDVLPRGHKPDADGRSDAPAVLVLVDKGDGILDAFWFFFYSYNLGQTVLGIRFGNHVGDWEHCMMRFDNGVPRAIYFSEHEGGQAYTYDAVEKYGDRPVIYSAVGSHAMYALPGTHPYILPFRLLKDETDKGPIWDPSLNNYAYHYDYTMEGFLPDDPDEVDSTVESLVPASKNPNAPTSWFHYAGRWGDEVYSLADMRQWRFFGQYHYVSGPFGPKFKRLDRTKVCHRTACRILDALDPKGTWY